MKFNLKRIDNYDPEYQEEFISQVYDIVKLIPDEIIESQNSYKKVLFKLIKNRDFDKLLNYVKIRTFHQSSINTEAISILAGIFRMKSYLQNWLMSCLRKIACF